MGLANFLPKEILEEVFGYLSWAELSVAGLVCHRWHEVVSDLHIKRFPLTLVLERPDRMRNLELMPSRISKVHHLCVGVPTHTVLNANFGQANSLMLSTRCQDADFPSPAIDGIE